MKRQMPADVSHSSSYVDKLLAYYQYHFDISPRPGALDFCPSGRSSSHGKQKGFVWKMAEPVKCLCKNYIRICMVYVFWSSSGNAWTDCSSCAYGFAKIVFKYYFLCCQIRKWPSPLLSLKYKPVFILLWNCILIFLISFQITEDFLATYHANYGFHADETDTSSASGTATESKQPVSSKKSGTQPSANETRQKQTDPKQKLEKRKLEPGKWESTSLCVGYDLYCTDGKLAVNRCYLVQQR